MVVEIQYPLIRLNPVGACIDLCLKEGNERGRGELWTKENIEKHGESG